MKNNQPESIKNHFSNIMALKLLKRETSLKKNVKSKQLRAGWDNDYLAKVLNA